MIIDYDNHHHHHDQGDHNDDDHQAIHDPHPSMTANGKPSPSLAALMAAIIHCPPILCHPFAMSYSYFLFVDIIIFILC